MHNYISLIKYVSNLTFDYVETYSLQRGTEYENSIKVTKPEYDKLKVRKEKLGNLTPQEEQRLNELQSLLGYTQYLINDNGQFHPSSVKTNTFKYTDPEAKSIIDILKAEGEDVPDWMCAPIYRDALVFYDNSSKIVLTLNVCLSCEHMETSMFNHVTGNLTTYKLLRQFFIDIGHAIEKAEPEASS